VRLRVACQGGLAGCLAFRCAGDARLRAPAADRVEKVFPKLTYYYDYVYVRILPSVTVGVTSV
jgi:hypothetical protein